MADRHRLAIALVHALRAVRAAFESRTLGFSHAAQTGPQAPAAQQSTIQRLFPPTKQLYPSTGPLYSNKGRMFGGSPISSTSSLDINY